MYPGMGTAKRGSLVRRFFAPCGAPSCSSNAPPPRSFATRSFLNVNGSLMSSVRVHIHKHKHMHMYVDEEIKEIKKKKGGREGGKFSS